MNTEIKDEVKSALFVGDDLSLDFINTAYGVDEGHHDYFASDADVVDWLRQAGVLPEGYRDGAPGGLAEAALELRAASRRLVEHRQAGKWADPVVLNKVLALGKRYPELRWKKGGRPEIVYRQVDEYSASILVPVAEALAKLLAEADFSLVRKCESDECTLLFHDRTKSHRRRWCSMALCGNRMKVAAYRARQKT